MVSLAPYAGPAVKFHRDGLTGRQSPTGSGAAPAPGGLGRAELQSELGAFARDIVDGSAQKLGDFLD
jgi:hypothetical protein